MYSDSTPYIQVSVTLWAGSKTNTKKGILCFPPPSLSPTWYSPDCLDNQENCQHLVEHMFMNASSKLKQTKN